MGSDSSQVVQNTFSEMQAYALTHNLGRGGLERRGASSEEKKMPRAELIGAGAKFFNP